MERARGALDLLLEIEECIKRKKRERKKPLPLAGREPCRDEFRSEKSYKRMECENAESTDRFSSVALSCHREIVPEVILYIITFIATINIILVRFINRPPSYYCYPSVTSYFYIPSFIISNL